MEAPKTLLLFLLVLLVIGPCFCLDSVTQSQPLKDGDFLISQGEVFQLGFFSPGKSSNRYVGVWYYKLPEKTVVWVANRDSPLTNTSGVLSVDTTGQLVLSYSGTPEVLVWSSNILSSTGGSNYSAKLLDTGNFVLFRDQDSEKNVVWQGFDHPTDTFLPDMKLQWNKRTKENKFLTSWKSPENPESGRYSFKFNVTGSVPQMFIYDGVTPVLRAGPWNGITFSGLPEYTVRPVNDVTDLFYIDNAEEVSTYYIVNTPGLFTRFVISDQGVTQRLNWNSGSQRWDAFWTGPDSQCDKYAHCGAFSNCNPVKLSDQICECLPGYQDRSGGKSPTNTFEGCVRKPGALVCRNGEGFKEVPGVKVPEATKAHLESHLGIKACKELCLKNCSCTACMTANITSGKGCLTWYGDLIDVREFSQGGQVLYLRVDSSELAKDPNKRVLLRVLLPVLVTIFPVLVLLSWLLRKKNRAKNNRNQEFSHGSVNSDVSFMERYQDALATNEIGTSSTEVHCFSASTIFAATDNFSFTKKLGEGGFGTVYKGQLHGGQDIAVKRLSLTSTQGIEEFRNEIILIAKLQHRNLVRLLGYCIQKEKILIYEYLPNRGLDRFIFAKNSELNWRTRFDIAMGIARGMIYLHHDSRLRIIHRDLKASNVLLDASMNPKISDFGMARIFGSDQNEETTKRVVGTYGYMSPEYAMEGLFSIKSDVFSYGVLLLEIISGRKNTSTFDDENSMNLIGHVWDRWLQGTPLEIVDASLESYDVSEVSRCIHIGLLCVQESAAIRPTMSEVASMLCNERTPPSPPEQPAFINRARVNFGSVLSNSSGNGATTVSEVTVSIVEGR